MLPFEASELSQMEEPVFVQNRIVVVVLPKTPFVEWVNRVIQGVADPVTLGEAREDPNAFLVPVELDEFDSPGERWLRQNWAILFERMLRDWYARRSLRCGPGRGGRPLAGRYDYTSPATIRDALAHCFAGFLVPQHPSPKSIYIRGQGPGPAHCATGRPDGPERRA